MKVSVTSSSAPSNPAALNNPLGSNVLLQGMKLLTAAFINKNSLQVGTESESEPKQNLY